MKFGLRIPSLKRRIAARTSWKRVLRHSLGLKVPKGMGLFVNPKKAIYNKIYNKTSLSIDDLLRVRSGGNSNFLNSQNKGMKDNKIVGIEGSGLGNIIRSSSKALTVTSKNFETLRQQITDIYSQRIELIKKLQIAKLKLLLLTFIHVLSFVFVIGFFYKKIATIRNEQLSLVKNLKDQIAETFVSLTFADKSQLEKSWLNCIDTFSDLVASEKIWDLTYEEAVDRAKERTVAKTSTKRTLLPSGVTKEIEFIKSDLQPLFLPNSNGPDLYFFPTFLLLYKDNQKFGIFDLREINISLKLMGYVEEEKVPEDTEIIQYTWKKANKDGSGDKRFKGNYQIPVVKYGNLIIESESGLEESFMFSGFEAFSEFTKSFVHHSTLLVKS